MTTTQPKINVTESDCGTWIDGSCSRSCEEYELAVIAEAESYGFKYDDFEDSEDADQIRSEVATDAVNFLNDLLPEGFCFEEDDGLILRTSEE